jgi:L-fucose mutarotase
MLKSIDPLLSPDILHALRAMGHGDEVVLCDSNFPASSIARSTTLGKCLRLDGIDTTRASRAILSVLPLDRMAAQAAWRMEIVGNPDEISAVQHEVQREIDRAEGAEFILSGLERFGFYERAARAYCIIASGELRFYGNFIFKKGTIAPAAPG